MFRLIIAGGRDFDNYEGMKKSLDVLLKNIKDDIQIVCGMARGADRLGERYAKENGYQIIYFPADWDLDGKSAGFKRNVEMADNADALVAFWDGQSRGTKHMIDTAKDKGLDVRVKLYHKVQSQKTSKITFHQGDLITDSPASVICHQVNCQGVMGSGIAKQIRIAYPRVFEQYQIYCSEKMSNNQPLLGRCQLVYTDCKKFRIVANLFGQGQYGTEKQQTDYKALQTALRSLAHNKFLADRHLTVAFPYGMGCGLGGGDWNNVSKLIDSEFKDYPGNVQVWRK